VSVAQTKPTTETYHQQHVHLSGSLNLVQEIENYRLDGLTVLKNQGAFKNYNDGDSNFKIVVDRKQVLLVDVTTAGLIVANNEHIPATLTILSDGSWRVQSETCPDWASSFYTNVSFTLAPNFLSYVIQKDLVGLKNIILSLPEANVWKIIKLATLIGEWEIVFWMIRQDVYHSNSVIMQAMRSGDIQIIEWIYQYYPHLSDKPLNELIFQQLIKYNQITTQLAKLIPLEPKIDEEILVLAIKTGANDVVQVLLDRGVKPTTFITNHKNLGCVGKLNDELQTRLEPFLKAYYGPRRR